MKRFVCLITLLLLAGCATPRSSINNPPPVEYEQHEPKFPKALLQSSNVIVLNEQVGEALLWELIRTPLPALK